MIVLHTEIFGILNNEDGRYLAVEYAEDLRNRGCSDVSITHTPDVVTVIGRSESEIPNHLISRFRASQEDIQHVGYTDEQCGRDK